MCARGGVREGGLELTPRACCEVLAGAGLCGLTCSFAWLSFLAVMQNPARLQTVR